MQPRITVKWWWLLVVLVVGLVAVLLTHYDAPLYSQTVAEVQQVKNGPRMKTTDEFRNQDYQQNQTVTLKILNGKKRGQTLRVQNQFSRSNATDQEYHPGQQVFLHLGGNSQRNRSGLINGFKRDTVVVFLVWLTVSLLLLILKFRGSMALLSLVVNALLFMVVVELDVHTDWNPFVLFSLLAVVFTIVTALLIFGRSKETLVAIIATILGTAAALLIAWLVLMGTHQRGMKFEMMDYVTQQRLPLFFAGSMIGSLGAIMDLSADITSSVFAIYREQPTMRFAELFANARKIGRSIMGPLINVLFLIFVASTFPMMVLFLKNGNSWGYSYSMIMSLGIVQSLISGIGIALTVPITGLLAGGICEMKVFK
ncbi:YibE/F family protein [Fructilactobacillus myrtifloralis]|uniref:YibE/F family protein n=1 Tax=Fructilactobacillus myrtifloralis TaxID=2940301 RepID=A0ABY5BQG1_9LACO|nr:YibE/F family protein [Fructilactobacillus myrtifloralis]USS85805.1 YibE/F family protein [Fructilactobacillus myrtifloralis]